MMIQKFRWINERDITTNENQISLQNKINELIDVINTLVQENNIHEKQIDKLQMKLEPEKCESHAENVLTMVDNQVTADLPNIDLGELAFLSKENTELKDEIDRLETELELTRKALKIAVDALKGIKDECYDTTDVLLCVNKALEQITTTLENQNGNC